MKIKKLLSRGREILERAEIENPGFEAELILAHLLTVDRVFLYTHDDDQVNYRIEKIFLEMSNRRADNEPLAYILGNKEFMGLKFKIDRNVLIPRPDTECLVEFLIDYLKESYPAGAKVLDLCTGSGAIGIALKFHYSKINLAISDISREALKIARENAKTLIQDDLIIYHSDLFEKIPKDQSFDLIVTNPPYIPKETIKNLAPEIINYEPKLALDGGKSGIDFYLRIINEAGLFLNPGGMLAMEIGDKQKDSIGRILRNSGFKNIRGLKDLTGLTRSMIGFF